MIRLQRILLPTDFSKYSAAATRYACELATRFDAELHLLHTLEIHTSSTPDFGMGLALPRSIQESRAAAEKSLTGVLDPKWSTGRTVIQAVVEGSPKVEIIRYARSKIAEADMKDPAWSAMRKAVRKAAIARASAADEPAEMEPEKSPVDPDLENASSAVAAARLLISPPAQEGAKP